MYRSVAAPLTSAHAGSDGAAVAAFARADPGCDAPRRRDGDLCGMLWTERCGPQLQLDVQAAQAGQHRCCLKCNDGLLY